MAHEDTETVTNIAGRHKGKPDEALFKVAALALRTVDIICEVCQGKMEAPEHGQEIG